MPQSAAEALKMIMAEAQLRGGKTYSPGSTTAAATGKIFMDNVRVTSDGRHLEINTVSGGEGFGVALDDWRRVVSFGPKTYAGDN